jgi:hypothetical protein
LFLSKTCKWLCSYYLSSTKKCQQKTTHFSCNKPDRHTNAHIYMLTCEIFSKF